MFDQSIIKTTGQSWKLVPLVAGLIVGGVLLILALRKSDHQVGANLFLSGVLFAVVSFVFAIASIRCPQCGMKWVWTAVSRQSQGTWFQWFMSASGRPDCGYKPDDGQKSQQAS